MNEWIIIGIIVIGTIYIVVACIYLLVQISNDAIYKRKRKRLDVAVSNVLSTYFRTREYEGCVRELEIAYNEIVSTNYYLKAEFPNMVSLLEKYVLCLNTEEITIAVDVDSYKKAIREFLKEYSRKNPLEQIKGADYVVLRELIDCLEKGEADKGLNIVNEVAIEIKGMQDKIIENEKNSRKQDAMTKVSIGLTIFFGVMTIIQFFTKS